MIKSDDIGFFGRTKNQKRNFREIKTKSLNI